MLSCCKSQHFPNPKFFVDDGWSGSDFNRHGFREMLEKLRLNPSVSIVATKDLSRFRRDMRESSFYVEQYFPEHGICYIAVNDNFDTDIGSNMPAPFRFAMNEVYLRDCSRKIKERILKNRVCLVNTYLYPNINRRTGSRKASRPVLMFRLFLQSVCNCRFYLLRHFNLFLLRVYRYDNLGSGNSAPPDGLLKLRDRLCETLLRLL